MSGPGYKKKEKQGVISYKHHLNGHVKHVVRKLKPWLNGLASRGKLKIWVYFNLPLLASPFGQDFSLQLVVVIKSGVNLEQV